MFCETLNMHVIEIIGHIIDLLTICQIIGIFEQDFTLHYAETPTRHKNVRSEEKCASVRVSFAENQNISFSNQTN